MDHWYHSGIEGYCKSAAQLAGMPDDASGWGNFGNDLFGDGRFDDPIKASKTWTLSRSRKQGRSNRPMLFEKSWLGVGGTDYELRAIAACVYNLSNNADKSMLYSVYQSDYLRFAAEFKNSVLVAIQDGFSTERYHSTDIARFSQNIDRLLGDLSPSDPRTFRNFATPLVAALIYGPAHVLACADQGEQTVSHSPNSEPTEALDYNIDESSIRISQLFGDNSMFMGYSELFGDDKVVFLGRGSKLDQFLAKCNPEFVSEIAGKQPVFFPIAHSHKRTSNAHGAIARLGETWYYHDFSTNGSYIENNGIRNAVRDSIALLQPGDCIHLGSSLPVASNEITYHLSSVVLISFNVTESSLFA